MSTSMAEDNKKPKIDLRARLGKKTVGGGNPSIPPPMATGGSIPAPPFASKPPPAMASERPRIVEPQAIKIEMSEEVVQAQKKGKTKILVMAIATGVVGGLIGYAVGGGVERGKKHTIALQGAEVLVGEVDAANTQVEKMDAVLKNISLKLSDGAFPEKEISELSEISIPFDSKYLLGKGTNLMSPKVNDMLLSFASQSVEANEARTEFAVMIGSLKNDFELHAKQAEKPVFQWAVFLQSGPQGPVASMLKVPEPFAIVDKDKADYKWPVEIEVPEGDKKVKYKLYKDGNPIASDPLLIPVDPASPGTQMLDEFNVKYYEVRNRLKALTDVLKGDHSDPTNDKTGLVDLGKNLMDELKGIGGG